MVAGLLLGGCATPTSNGPALHPDFAGTWTGIATFALSGGTTVAYPLPLEIAVAEETVRLANICPGTVQQQSMRTGSMRLPTENPPPSSAVNATGSGGAASWSGTLECPPVELKGCPSLAVSYTNANVTLTGVNQLTLVVLGNAVGCGIHYPVFLTFVGSK